MESYEVELDGKTYQVGRGGLAHRVSVRQAGAGQAGPAHLSAK